MMRADDIGKRPPPNGPGRLLSMLLLIALPVVLTLGFFGWNLFLISQQKTAQEITADACALAGGQSMVDDKALTGTNISDLEDMALVVAKQYDTYNPLWPGVAPADHLNILDTDLAFTTVDVTIGPDTLTLIDTMMLTGRRTAAHTSADFPSGNPVPILGGGLFASPTVDINAIAKVALDRRVAGLRPVYGKTIVLSPLAIQASTWASQVEAGLPLGDLTIKVGTADTSYLQIGTADESEFAYQLSAVGGVTPSNLAGLGGQFFLDIVKGLDVPVLGGDRSDRPQAGVPDSLQKPTATPASGRCSRTDGRHEGERRPGSCRPGRRFRPTSPIRCRWWRSTESRSPSGPAFCPRRRFSPTRPATSILTCAECT